MALTEDILNLPILVDGANPIVHHVDTCLIVLSVIANQLLIFKDLLNKNTYINRVKLYYHKSSMIPSNVSPEEVAFLGKVFECQIGFMSFTYLPIPMGTRKPSIK